MIWKIISGIVGPLFKGIDEIHTSDEERMKMRAELLGAQTKLTEMVMNYETKLLDSQASIIQAEATGQSWIQRNWRPLTMLTFLVLIVADSLGFLVQPLASEMWTLMQFGLGGYVVGRSGEKIAKTLKVIRSNTDVKGDS